MGKLVIGVVAATLAVLGTAWPSIGRADDPWTVSGENVYYNPRPNTISVISASYTASTGGATASCLNYVQSQCNGRTLCAYAASNANCGTSVPESSGPILFVTYQCGSQSFSRLSDQNVQATLSCPGAGFVGVGTPAPEAKLDVRGEIKLASTDLACSGATAGAQRYDSGLRSMEFCDGSSWLTLFSVPAFNNLQRQIDSLKSEVTTLKGTLSAAQDAVKELKNSTGTSISDLKAQVTLLRQQTAALQKAMPAFTFGNCSINGFINSASLPSNPDKLVVTAVCPNH